MKILFFLKFKKGDQIAIISPAGFVKKQNYKFYQFDEKKVTSILENIRLKNLETVATILEPKRKDPGWKIGL